MTCVHWHVASCVCCVLSISYFNIIVRCPVWASVSILGHGFEVWDSLFWQHFYLPLSCGVKLRSMGHPSESSVFCDASRSRIHPTPIELDLLDARYTPNILASHLARTKPALQGTVESQNKGPRIKVKGFSTQPVIILSGFEQVSRNRATRRTRKLALKLLGQYKQAS